MHADTYLDSHAIHAEVVFSPLLKSCLANLPVSAVAALVEANIVCACTKRIYDSVNNDRYRSHKKWLLSLNTRMGTIAVLRKIMSA